VIETNTRVKTFTMPMPLENQYENLVLNATTESYQMTHQKAKGRVAFTKNCDGISSNSDAFQLPSSGSMSVGPEEVRREHCGKN
jgi:hypothetical protein